MRSATYVFLVISTIASQSVNAQSCDSVLKYTGTKTLQELSRSQSEDIDYYFNCTSEGKQKAGNLEVIYNAVTVKLGGSSYKDTKTCTEKQRKVDFDNLNIVLRSEPVEAAIEAWLSCEKARRSNLEIEMFDDSDAVGTRISNPTTGDISFFLEASKVINGANSDVGPSCNILPPSSRTKADNNIVEFVIKPKTSVAISCKRDVVTENRDGIFTRFNPSMNIRLTSADVSRFSFPFVEKIIDGGRVARLDAVEKGLGEARGAIGMLDGRMTFMGGGNPQARGYAAAINNGIGHGTASCPAGEYVAGVTFWGAGPGVRYCVGCFHGAQVVCKPFKQ